MARAGERGGWLREGRADNAPHPIEKAPQFRASIDRFAERAGERLSATFGVLFSAGAEKSRIARVFATLNDHADQPAAALYSATLDQRMALLFDGALADLLIGAMFGAEAVNDEGGDGPRTATALEMHMIGEVADTLAAALRDAFAPVADVELAADPAETIDDDSLLGPKDATALVTAVNVKAPAGSFVVVLLIPYPFLTGLAGALARGPAPGAANLDPVWSNRMERRVTEASLTLVAVLDDFEMSLGDVSSLRPGLVLPLSEGAERLVRIECDERGVFVCSLGERNGRYALEVEDIIAKPVEGPYPPTSP